VILAMQKSHVLALVQKNQRNRMKRKTKRKKTRMKRNEIVVSAINMYNDIITKQDLEDTNMGNRIDVYVTGNTGTLADDIYPDTLENARYNHQIEKMTYFSGILLP